MKLAGMVASILSAAGLLTLSVANLSASLDGPVTFNPLEVGRRSPAHRWQTAALIRSEFETKVHPVSSQDASE